MPTDSSVSLKNAREKRNDSAEVSEAEKQLWARIQSKGVLDKAVKDLYYKACRIYEKLFLSENELPNLQTIEYLLWRLHYKHIDEFRRRISQSSSKEEDKLSPNQKRAASRRNMVDEHMEGFKLFLSEAVKFYQDLIRKIKRYYGLVDEPWFYKNERVSSHVEQTKLRKCQFVCHRLCICLGDLARYFELYEKPNNQQRNWSVAANCYIEAAKIYPDGGNPQNQLAVLATYIGDEFLALYHCIRSLAVEEPFPDALQNLVLLFERNRSSNISSLSNEVYDFSKPSEWIFSLSKAANGGYSNKTTSKTAENDQSLSTDLWSLIIRLTSFFFLESSLDTFLCTFTSTLRELEVLLALDVVKLSSSLDSYKNMNLSKAGPYRALHLISVLLFIIHNLNEEPQWKILKPTNETHHSMLVKLALTVAFICMGRLVDRCLKGSPVIYFPLLPALLVFVEWLVGALDKIDANIDEKCETSMCYFFGSFVELVNYLQVNTAEITFPGQIALWEDYELRGFVPLSHTHASLDFSSHWEEEINYKMKNEYRVHRIIQAAMKIAMKPHYKTRKWLFYSEAGRKFSTVEAMEEEEDIVFKPIARHNSEPIPMDDREEIASSSNECLRRASSLLVAQNRALIDSFTSHTAVPSASSSKQGQNGNYTEVSIAAGPPSLSSWVLNGAKSSEVVHRSVLKPIEEVVSEVDLSKDESFRVSPSVTCPSTDCVPVPSAPLLPDTGHTRSYPWSGPQFPNIGNHNLQPAHNHAPRNLNGVYGSEASRFDLFDGWSYNHPMASSPVVWFEGIPPPLQPSSSLLRGLHDQRKDMLLQGLQRPQPQPLLQYLKHREWQLQQESQFTGSSPYMKN